MRKLRRNYNVRIGFFIVAGMISILHLVSCGGEKTKDGVSVSPRMPDGEANVLVSRLAGTWYNERSAQLETGIRAFFEMVPRGGYRHVSGLILPHAGYAYSGKVAAIGVKQIEGKQFHRVVILGPSHRYPMENNVSVPPFTHYRTPLGDIPLDREFIERLKTSVFVKSIRKVHEYEHSIQIQLPFLQVAIGEFLLVPVIVGRLNAYTADTIAALLLSLVDEETLVAVSSDFIHFGPNYGYLPFTDDVERNIEKLDMEACDYILRKDPAGFRSFCERTGATICGRDAIEILLSMCGPETEPLLLDYETSGKITGDMTNSVSYASFVITGGWKKPENVPSEPISGVLSEIEQGDLLLLARKTLEYYMEYKEMPEPEGLGIGISPAMEAIRGAFVTLSKDGRLKGCIGDVFPLSPLYKVVMKHAVNAAVHDTRFQPVTKDEVGELEIEISVLTMPQPVDSYKEIVIGRQGIVLSKMDRSAVFLPQVAPQQGWGLEETLANLALKAGLPGDSWKDGCEFFVFEADVFKEGHDLRP
ncbi:MAG: AmmeMemoRadiSam system protein B [Spirochaetales bacterium]|nr:AmmeMemoRadiSam system protein B [Spirochaetales bacterium]